MFSFSIGLFRRDKVQDIIHHLPSATLNAENEHHNGTVYDFKNVTKPNRCGKSSEGMLFIIYNIYIYYIHTLYNIYICFDDMVRGA